MMIKRNPLFIIGNPRSGTSLFRLMLTSHPSICVPPECGFIQWWYNKYKDWTQADSEDLESLNEYIKDLSSSKKIETWNLNYSLLKDKIIESKPSNYAELSLLVIKHFAEINSNSKTEFFGDKNNYYISTENLNLLNRLFPDSIFLFIVRDGRDVACSYRNMQKLKSDSKYKPVLSSDIEQIASEWSLNNLNALHFFKGFAEKRFMLTKFEDLIQNPQLELEKVTEFLGLKYSDSMLTYNELNKNSVLEPKELMDWKQKTYELPDIANIFKYKRELEPREIKKFNEVAMEALKKFGYEV